MSDEELQKRIESDEAENTIDAVAYRKVFQSLQREPAFRLSGNFADRVMTRVYLRQRRSTSRERWLFAVGFVLIVLGLIITLAMVNYKPGIGIYTFISGHAGLFIFGATLIFVLNFLDRKFIRPVKTE